MTEQREIELRMLNLLRDPSYARRFGQKVKPRHLSPEGQVIFKSLMAVLPAAAKRLSVPDLDTAIRSHYRKHDLEAVFEYTALLSEYERDFEQPELIDRIFTKEFTAVVLKEIAGMASAQMGNGLFNLEAIKDVLATDTNFSLGLEAADFTRLPALLAARERVPVSIGTLDNEFQGGLGRKELGIVAGPPKRGKSATLVNITGGELKRGHSVLYISLSDLFEHDIMTRIAAWYGRVTEKEIIEYPDLAERVQNHMQAKGCKLFIADRNHLQTTLGDVETLVAQATKTDPGLRLVIVDRADTLQPPRSYNDKRHNLKDIYTDLRRIAAAYNVAVWADSQADSSTYTSKKVGMAKSSEDKIGKTGITDLWLGITRDTEDSEVHYVTIDGRRKITNEFFRFRLNKDYFTLTQEATYTGEEN